MARPNSPCWWQARVIAVLCARSKKWFTSLPCYLRSTRRMNGEEGGRRAPRTRPLFPLMAHQRGRQGVGLKFPPGPLQDICPQKTFIVGRATECRPREWNGTKSFEASRMTSAELWVGPAQGCLPCTRRARGAMPRQRLEDECLRGRGFPLFWVSGWWLKWR